MGRWPITSLLLISAQFLLPSCGTQKQSPVISNECRQLLNQRITSATYYTTIDFGPRHFTGLMVFKATDDTTKRAVFITETGFKFFDFEFTPSNFAVKYCLPRLNKPVVIKTLSRDFGMLLQPSQGELTKRSVKQGQAIYKFKDHLHGFYYFSTAANCSTLQEMAYGGAVVKKVRIAINGVKNGSFDSLLIHHPFMGLKIKLNRLER